MGRGSQFVLFKQNQLTNEPGANSKVNQNFSRVFEFGQIISKVVTQFGCSLLSVRPLWR